MMLTSVCASETKKIHLAYVDYPPFYGPNLPDGGPFTEIINAAFDDQGYSVQFTLTPWARGYKSTQAGEFDGIFTAWYREEREQKFLFSDALPANEVVFFKRKSDDIRFENYASLKPYQIGVVRGYAQPEAFTNANLNTQAVKSDEQNLKKLARGFIDLTPIDRAVGKYLLRTQMKNVADQIDWIEPPIEVAKQYIIFSKAAEDAELKRSAFNRGLQNVTENGTLKTILDKHQY